MAVSSPAMRRCSIMRPHHLENTMCGHRELLRCASIDEATDTEIDWKAYMEQVELYIDGERDYTKIRGGTGPLVYPGAHVYVYRLLYTLTGQGTNILTAQILFAALYIAVLVVVMACYRKAKVFRHWQNIPVFPPALC